MKKLATGLYLVLIGVPVVVISLELSFLALVLGLITAVSVLDWLFTILGV